MGKKDKVTNTSDQQKECNGTNEDAKKEEKVEKKKEVEEEPVVEEKKWVSGSKEKDAKKVEKGRKRNPTMLSSACCENSHSGRRRRKATLRMSQAWKKRTKVAKNWRKLWRRPTPATMATNWGRKDLKRERRGLKAL